MPLSFIIEASQCLPQVKGYIMPTKEFNLCGITFTSDTEYSLTMTTEKYDGDRASIGIKIELASVEMPKPVKIKWRLPLAETISIWSPSYGDLHCISPNWAALHMGSRSASNLPLYVCTDVRGKSTLAAALSDFRNPSEFSIGVIEESGELTCSLTLFAEITEPIKEYECTLRIDRDSVDFYDKAREISDEWRKNCPEADVPEAAKMPMYSTWYSMHQKLDSDDLVAELKLAKQYGMDSVIVDDGWQTDDNNRGYAFCGDWEPTPSKIPDMKALVDAVHSVGMKIILWYSVPFVGEHSKAYARFKDKFHHTWEGVGVLDPRYPDVRDYLCKTYERAVKEWGLDGFKLDFIDSFRHLENETPTLNDQMDHASIQDAVCALLDEIKARLSALKPDMLFEFRQSYVGPVMRRLGNMLRVGDCPADIMRNRVNGINLRFITDKTAVHSDMLMWHTETSVESAALQIANSFFLVPQISVRIENLPESHKKMLAFYMDLWRKWRDCLIEGRLTARDPAANYTSAESIKDGRQFTVLFSRSDLEIKSGISTLAVINASWQSPTLIRNTGEPFAAKIEIKSCTGTLLSAQNITVPHGVLEIEIPNTGVMVLAKE